MSFEKPYYFVAMVFSPLWEGPKWLEVAIDANFASIRLDADQSKRFSLAQMQLSIANDQQKTWYLAWRDEIGKWAIGIHDTVLQKQLKRTPPPALASQLGSLGISKEKKKRTLPNFTSWLPSSKTLSKYGFILFIVAVLFVSFRDRLLQWSVRHFIALDVAQEMKIGDELYRVRYPRLHVVQNPFLQATLDDASRRLLHGTVFSYAWVIVNDDKSYDIDALPGGIMLVPTGLLRRLESLDELYGVMGNRIQLVEQHAVTQELVASAGWPAFWALYKHRYREAAKYMAPFSHNLVYSQRNQFLADRPVFIRLWMMNVDPTKWMHYLEREANWQKKDPALKQSAYPITLERMNYIKEIDTRKPPSTMYVASVFDWNKVEQALATLPDLSKPSPASTVNNKK